MGPGVADVVELVVGKRHAGYDEQCGNQDRAGGALADMNCEGVTSLSGQWESTRTGLASNRMLQVLGIPGRAGTAAYSLFVMAGFHPEAGAESSIVRSGDAREAKLGAIRPWTAVVAAWTLMDSTALRLRLCGHPARGQGGYVLPRRLLMRYAGLGPTSGFPSALCPSSGKTRPTDNRPRDPLVRLNLIHSVHTPRSAGRCSWRLTWSL